jgi:hypothetical protein
VGRKIIITGSTWVCRAGCSCDNGPDSCWILIMTIRCSQAIIHFTVELNTNVSETYSASIIRVRLNIIILHFYIKMMDLRLLALNPYSERVQKHRSYLFTRHISLLVSIVAVSLTWCNCNLHIFSVTFQV